MQIEKAYEVCCYECGEPFEEINIIELSEEDIYLCDECLEELNTRINEHLKYK